MGLETAAAAAGLMDEPRVIEEITLVTLPMSSERCCARLEAQAEAASTTQSGCGGSRENSRSGGTATTARRRLRVGMAAAGERAIRRRRPRRGDDCRGEDGAWRVRVVGLVRRRLPGRRGGPCGGDHHRGRCRRLKPAGVPDAGGGATAGHLRARLPNPAPRQHRRRWGNRDRVVLAVCLAKGEEAARAGLPVPAGIRLCRVPRHVRIRADGGRPERPAGDEVGRSSDAA